MVFLPHRLGRSVCPLYDLAVEHSSWTAFRARVLTPAFGALLALTAFTLAPRFFFYFGLVNVDPFSYADAAVSISRWQPAFDPSFLGEVSYTQYVRLSIIVPAAMLYRLFGVSDAASTAFPMLVSVALVACGFWFGRRLAGLPAGIATGFLLALQPVAIVNSTQFLPDAPQAAFVGMATMFLIGIVSFELPPRQRIVLAFLGGGVPHAWVLRTGHRGRRIPPTWRRVGYPACCQAQVDAA